MNSSVTGGGMLNWRHWSEPVRIPFLHVKIKICLSFSLFRFLQFVVRWYLFGKCTFKTFSYFRRRKYHGRPVPDNRSLEVIPPNKKWRISNEVVSLIHSVVSGMWALYACITLPELVSDMDTFQHEMPKNLVYLSFGYLIHDLIDLLVNERSFRIMELLFHHVVVITAFTVTLLSNRFLGILMVGLLMELNSIFLHTRSLLNLYGLRKKSTAFKFVALLNVVTFLVFRIVISFYLFYWWFNSALGVVVWHLATITFLVATSLTITNLVLFYRVLAADGLFGKGKSRPAEPIINIVIPSNQSTSNLEEVQEDDVEERDFEDDAEDDGDESSLSGSSSSEDGNTGGDVETGLRGKGKHPPKQRMSRSAAVAVTSSNLV